MHPRSFLPSLVLTALLLLLLGAACPVAIIAQDRSLANSGEVVVYTALDKQFSEPILNDFQAATGIRVRPVYDAEAVKTVGLVNRLLAERQRPRADVFWNNEIVRSIQLKKEGLTEAYDSPSARDIPAPFRDPEHHWTGFAARARVIMVNRRLLPNESEWPRRVQDLADPKWKGRASFAKPLFGTTNTHAAVIWAGAGPDAARAFWAGALENSLMLAGNAQARDAAAAGEVAWCWTDTDDAHGAVEDGAPVAIVYPTDDPAGPGALFIPNTVVLIRNSPNPDNGRKLIDYLLSREVEAKLAQSRSAQIPVREGIPGPQGIPALSADQILKVDWNKAYEALDPSTAWLEQQIQSR